MHRSVFLLALLGTVAATHAQSAHKSYHTPRCPPYEKYLHQTTRCQITCKTPREINLGFCWPSSGCFCEQGYARNESGICVIRASCPGYCRKNEKYTECGTTCPETCESRGKTCNACFQSCVMGCVCDENTIRAPNGTCVEPNDCPPRTCSGRNEEFVVCPPNCPPTEKCSNIWSKFDCSNYKRCCTPSCRCKAGFYRNDQNVCVSFQQCLNSFSFGSIKKRPNYS